MGDEAFGLGVQRRERPLDLAEAMRWAAALHGLTLVDQVHDILRLGLGRGRLEPREYFLYGLCDHARHDLQSRRSFLGRVAARRLGRGQAGGEGAAPCDKLQLERMLRAHGLPTATTLARYGGEGLPNGVRHIADEAALRLFLREVEERPLLGKPLRGGTGIDVLGILGWEPATDGVVLAHGRRVTVLRMVTALAPFAAGGYLFQLPLRPHPELLAVHGSALSTVRVLVLQDRGGPLIHRCAWKVPACGNLADSFWRQGNLLAALDPDTGRVWRVVDDIHPRQREIEHHPDSGARLRDLVLPDWTGLRALVLAATELFPASRRLGLDVALTDDGPVLVEVAPHGGDPLLVQLAHDQGLLDAAFERFRAGLVAARPARRAA
jgi:hypothetical protein